MYPYVVLLCLILPAFTVTAAKTPVCKYHYYHESTEVNGHSTTIEYYVPDGRGRHPLVFMLHGSAGAFTLRSNDEPSQDNFGEKTLAQNCFAVVFPHYLEAIGYKSIVSRQDITAKFPALLEVAGSFLTDAEALPWVRGKPVFLFGESLGSFLSIALAFEHNEVSAVSEFSGGLPTGYSLKRLGVPTVLIFHGDADSLVPVSEAEALSSYCVNHGIPVELKLYQGEGHYLSRAVQNEVLSRTVKFFLAQIKDALPKAKPSARHTSSP
jgi:dipeptidyl aminopeptidase/acylaminoacyl peptidase